MEIWRDMKNQNLLENIYIPKKVPIFMRKSNLIASGLLSLCLTSGCAQEKRKEIDPTSIGIHIIESETGFYEGYSVTASIHQVDCGKPHEDNRVNYLEVFDYQKKNLIAKITAVTETNTESPFSLVQGTRWTHFPEGHPFEDYTPEKFEQIYNSVMKKE